jgi:DNA-binding response OmpR family regulator
MFNSGDRKQILLIEDDAGTAHLTILCLELKGFRVHWVDSGEYALRVLTGDEHAGPELTPNLIMLDLRLADVSGVELVRRLRERRAAIPPILLVSGETEAVLQQIAAELGASYLRKPYDIDQLLRSVNQLLAAPPAAKPEFDFTSPSFHGGTRLAR